MRFLRSISIASAIGCFGISLHAQLVDGIKAIVHDSVVTYQEVEAFTAPAADLLRRQYRTQPDVYERKLAEARNENLDRLIERQLIIHDFKSAGYNLPESYIDDAVQDRIRARYGDRAKLTKSLQAEGQTYEKFRQQMRDQIIIEALRAKNISSEIIISPHKIETYYLAHQDKFQLEDQVKLRMIVLIKPPESEASAARQLAQEILGRIKEGAAFSEMAAVYSHDPQRSQGGDWGWWERKTLNPGLAAIAFALKPGELSGIISYAGTETNFWFCEYNAAGQLTQARRFELDPVSKKESLVEERKFESADEAADLPPPSRFYLMLVEEKRTAHVKPLSDVQEETEKILLTQERNRLQKQYVDRLRKKTFIRYF